MARIAICEPVAETRELFECLVSRLGHDVVDDGADVVLFEPAGPLSFAEVRARHPGAHILVASIEPPPAEPRIERWSAWLLKPFSLAELRKGLETAHSPAWTATASVSPAT